MQNGVVSDWFVQFGDDVYSFLVYLLRTRDVEDLVQETFLRAIKSLATFRGESQPKSWLLSIARNVAYDYRRKLSRQPATATFSLEGLQADTRTPDEILASKDGEERLVTTLHQLKAGYAEVVICRAILGLSGQETADVLGWSLSRVHTTFHRATQAARTILTRGGLDYDDNKSESQPRFGI